MNPYTFDRLRSKRPGFPNGHRKRWRRMVQAFRMLRAQKKDPRVFFTVQECNDLALAVGIKTWWVNPIGDRGDAECPRCCGIDVEYTAPDEFDVIYTCEYCENAWCPPMEWAA